MGDDKMKLEWAPATASDGGERAFLVFESQAE